MESNAVPALTFPHPELTSIEGVPDFAALQQMKTMEPIAGTDPSADAATGSIEEE